MEFIRAIPRLYVCVPLLESVRVALNPSQSHYVRNVMRLQIGGKICVFNGVDGEFLAHVESLTKNAVVLVCDARTFDQPEKSASLTLIFAPIKKNHMDFIIEKSVELGVTDLHPVLTAHTQVRKLNEERLRAQIVEAAEQCGRLEVPVLHGLEDLKVKMARWDKSQSIYFAAERLIGTELLSQKLGASTFLIGPEGGFDEQETDFLVSLPFVRPVSLGPRILRADTAALYCLALGRAP